MRYSGGNVAWRYVLFGAVGECTVRVGWGSVSSRLVACGEVMSRCGGVLFGAVMSGDVENIGPVFLSKKAGPSFYVASFSPPISFGSQRPFDTLPFFL